VQKSYQHENLCAENSQYHENILLVEQPRVNQNEGNIRIITGCKIHNKRFKLIYSLVFALQ